MVTQLWSIVTVVGACLIGSFGPIFLKKSSNDFNLNPIKQIKNKNLLIGLFFYGIGSVLFIPALKGGELSILYPLVATSYIWVSFWSVKFLGEKMNKFKWLGIILILFGALFIGLGS